MGEHGCGGPLGIGHYIEIDISRFVHSVSGRQLFPNSFFFFFLFVPEARNSSCWDAGSEEIQCMVCSYRTIFP